MTFRGAAREDADGNLIPGTGSFTKFCRVWPAGFSDMEGQDFDGNTTTLTVQAPAGAPYEVGMQVEVRGELYEVIHVPFDWSHGRRAAHPRHQPQVMLTVELPQAD